MAVKEAVPSRWTSWLLTAAVTVFGAMFRFWNIGHPPGTVFDEVYYSVEAQELLRFGYEDNRGYLFVVHPPLGKWFIALGSAIAGNDETGWRVASAVAGTIAVLITTRVAMRMFRSLFFGLIAGLLLSMEGLSLVLSRVALLDIFLQPLLIGAFAALVCDRDQLRGRLTRLRNAGVDLTTSLPTLGPRPWRLLAGVLLGLACAVKWSALSFVVAMALMSLLWDRGALRAAGVRRPRRYLFTRFAPGAAGAFLVASSAAYVLTWTGWFAGENSYGRHSTGTGVWGAARSFAEYHLQAYRFHESLTTPHAFGSTPWSWLVMGRPVNLYYDGGGGCGARECSAQLFLGGTPLLWWGFAPAVIWCAWRYATRRDWRAGATLAMFAAGWLVWFSNTDRTMFLSYMAPTVPFLILGLTLALGSMLGSTLGGRRRLLATALVCGYLGLVVADFAWMWPLFRGASIPTSVWQLHIWFPTWS